MPITKTGKKKDGLQQYRVRINYTDSLGKAHQVERTAHGMEEAKQLEIALTAEYKDKRTATRLTVGELYNEYIRYHSHETRRTTQDNTNRILRLRVLPYFLECRLDKLSQPVLADWKNKIASETISLSTKKVTYAKLVAMLNYAVKMGYILKNPLTVLGNFKSPEQIEKSAEKLHYYTPEQFLAYITIAHSTAFTCLDWGYYMFFNIAFYTGARKGEINALKWSDIEGNVMHIRRSISQKVKGGDIETPPKNQSSIVICRFPDRCYKY